MAYLSHLTEKMFVCSARFSAEFLDAVKRAKHHHCRCGTCASLEQELMQTWKARQDLTAVRKKISEHQGEVRAWRDFETYLQNVSTHTPSSMVLLSYDDTSALGLPRFSNRPIKNMTTGRVNVIPFNLTNHGASEQFYFYTLKGQFLKGANRLCTTLFHVLRRIKGQSSTPVQRAQQQARRLVLLADNCSENKNNTLLCFLHRVDLEGTL
jgi:hypothetical protein